MAITTAVTQPGVVMGPFKKCVCLQSRWLNTVMVTEVVGRLLSIIVGVPR